jgi:nucleoredoxin
MPATFDFKTSLPATMLKTVNGEKQEVQTADALGGKVYALYFSAHWCPPCRGFTPMHMVAAEVH